MSLRFQSQRVTLRLFTVDRSAFSNLPRMFNRALKSSVIRLSAYSNCLLTSAMQLSWQYPPFQTSSLAPSPTFTAAAFPWCLLHSVTSGKPATFQLLHRSPKDTYPSQTSIPTWILPLQPYLNRTQQQLATLNYLCTANGNALPSTATFPWNRVNATQLNNYNSAIGINRNTLANYFRFPLRLRHCIAFHGNWLPFRYLQSPHRPQAKVSSASIITNLFNTHHEVTLYVGSFCTQRKLLYW